MTTCHDAGKRQHRPARRSHRVLRLVSGIGIALLPLALYAWVAQSMYMADAYGASARPDNGGWLAVASGVVGISALVLPARAGTWKPRVVLMAGQFLLLAFAFVSIAVV
ncbi:hypothetical protein [Streptomyces sp. NPDC047108]|uniref:hypothetical protein n=1 Tax=Streptomyces sp. NPDC047108 TaxID=3155025 RepID=UPI0033DB33A8